jgi:hypothetical protein
VQAVSLQPGLTARQLSSLWTPFRALFITEPVRSCENLLRDRQTDSLRDFEIGDQFKFHRLFNRQMMGLEYFEILSKYPQ